jgi:hypothetical protein
MEDEDLDFVLKDFIVNGEERIFDFCKLNNRGRDRLRVELRDLLYFLGFNYKSNFKVKGLESWCGYRKYLDFFVKNIFLSTSKLGDLSNLNESYLFRGTSSNFLDIILRNGLDPDCCGRVEGDVNDEKVWFTNNLYCAELFALNASLKCGGSPAIVIVEFGDYDFEGLEKWDVGKYISVFDIYAQFSTKSKVDLDRIYDCYVLSNDFMFCKLLGEIRDGYRG